MEDGYKDLNVKHFKLSSGDEVLGLIAGIDMNKGVMHIEYPVVIDMMGDTYMMADYMPTSVKNIVAFSVSHIIAQSDVHESVKHEYIKYCLGATDSDEPEHESDPFEELMDIPGVKPTYH